MFTKQSFYFHLLPARAAALFLVLLLCEMREISAQGTISIYNSAHNMHAYVTDSRSGERLSGSDWLGQLYYSPILQASEAALVPAPGPAVYFATGDFAGYFDTSQDLVRVLPDLPGAKGISVQLRVWNACAGSTYEEAASNPIGVVGKSDVGGGSTGIPGFIPGSILDLEPFSVYSVPEPSVLGIILTGMIGAAILRDRK